MVRLTYCLDMTLVVDWDVKQQNNKLFFIPANQEGVCEWGGGGWV